MKNKTDVNISFAGQLYISVVYESNYNCHCYKDRDSNIKKY